MGYAKLVLATRLIRPFTLTFYRSLGIKNIQLKVLYLLHANAGQGHTICTLSSFCPYTVYNPASVLV